MILDEIWFLFLCWTNLVSVGIEIGLTHFNNQVGPQAHKIELTRWMETQLAQSPARKPIGSKTQPAV